MKIFFLLLIISSNIIAKDFISFDSSKFYKEMPKGYYYYNPEEVGAQSFFHPYQIVIEGGFGTLYNRKISEFDFKSGIKSLSYTLTHPIEIIEDYGVWNFFHDEFIPHTGPRQYFIANYSWHFIALGMRTKLLDEYYRFHNYKHHKLLAWSTIYSLHFINELIQAEKFKTTKGSSDALPDLFFFDWLGGLFFSFDGVNNIMSGFFHLREWTHQSQLNPLTGRLINNGQLFWSRVKIYDKFSISLLSGEQINTVNLSYEFANKQTLSLGIGRKVKVFTEGKNGTTTLSGLVPTIGIYYSINDNPLLTITYEPRKKADSALFNGHQNEYTQKLLINLYPGLIDINGFKPGITLSFQKDAFFIGISSKDWPLGFIFSTPQRKEYLNAE